MRSRTAWTSTPGGDSNCCLPRGATEATLVGNLFSLAAGDVLIFEEKLGPKTGDAADADPTRRCAVRLTSVSTTDFKQRPLVDPLYNNQPITHITWSLDDALPFPICISSTIGSDLITGVSIAHGNIVPADHGLWISSEPLGQVPETPLAPLASAGCNCASRSPITTPRPFYYPELTKSPLTFAVGYDPTASASAFLFPDVSAAIPQINLQSADNFTWSAAPDLLSSLDNDRVFVPEIDQDGTVFLRFGDGLYGMAPDPNLAFFATYRVGNGTAGNIGRDTLGHIRFPGQPATLSGQTISEQALSEIEVHNPLSGAGGVDPENMEHIRQYAPFAFQSQERCVTAEDYGQAAAQSSDIREARGTLRWTGSWYTAFVSIDPVSALTTKLMADTTRRLDLLRMMGTDLAVEGAVIVGLLIEMEICVDPEHFQGDVFGALMQVFVSGDQCDGQSGILNASNFTFGETVYASPLIAAAQSVEGVISVTLSTFTRMDDPSIDGVAQGFLAMGRLEIPHCDNDPNHLDRGQFILHLDGGK